MQAALKAEFERAQAQLAQLGDVQQALAMIEANSHNYATPAPSSIPFSNEDAKAWIKAAGSARTVAEHNLQQLGLVEPLAYLPNNPGTPQTGSPYDLNDVLRLRRNSTEMLNAVQANYETMAQQLASRMQQIEQDTLTRWQDNPESDEKRWLFIADGQQEEAEAVYAEAQAIANSSVYFERVLGREPEQALALIPKIEQALVDFEKNRRLALNSSRLLEPKSNDEDMLDIAERILAIPRYEFGEHGPIVLTTSEIVERERRDSEIEIDDAELSLSGDLKMSGTETTWTYSWQEFKFATPIREAKRDTWYIWWITAKNFSSGGPHTPLNQWISGEANKGNPILPESM